MQSAVLPEDAAVEPLTVDEGLSFLNAYVQQALQAGAAPYVPEEERRAMGIVRQSASDAASQVVPFGGEIGVERGCVRGCERVGVLGDCTTPMHVSPITIPIVLLTGWQCLPPPAF